MRHIENRKVRKSNWDPANSKGSFNSTVKEVAGLFGVGRKRPCGSAIRGSEEQGGYEGVGTEEMGAYGEQKEQVEEEHEEWKNLVLLSIERFLLHFHTYTTTMDRNQHH